MYTYPFILSTRRSKNIMLRHIKQLFALALFSFILLILAAFTAYYILAPQLPVAATLKETQLQVPLRIYSAENKLLAELGDKRRIPVEYATIPKQLVHAFLAAEDDRFFEHPGVDYQGLLRAAFSLITTGTKAQGGSTITMQVARNFFLSTEKTYLRKLNEIILALKIEQVLTKEEILTLYLNKIYLGKRAYGIGAAANVYYGKTLDQLTIPEMAMIAGLPKAPSRYNPIADPERAMQRRNYVLRRMYEVGYIEQAEFQQASLEPITAKHHGREIEVYAPYVAEQVRTQLIEEYGEEAYSIGLNVYTTIQAKHQQAANDALQKALFAYDMRHGFRGPIKQVTLDETMSDDDFDQILADSEVLGPLTPGLVTSIDDQSASVYVKANGSQQFSLKQVSWAKKYINTNRYGTVPKKITDVMSIGDVLYFSQDDQDDWQLAQLPDVEGALIALSPHNGAITALNGGFDYFNSKYNRVTQSRRQPGSGFKPFIYSAALEKGYTAASIINDAPVVFDDPSIDNVWRPSNYSGKFFGPTRLREALTHSRNLVSIRILRDITPEYAIEYASQFGFSTEQMPHNLSLALGSGSAAPWDMARAYASLANGGYRIEPFLIQRVENAMGEVLYQANPDTVCETCLVNSEDSEQTLTDDEQSYGISPAKRIMTPQNNYIMNTLLRDVIREGTGRKAMSLGRNDLAGKTGTTNDQVDAWFNGFHPELVAISWVGFDSPRTLGRYETGGKAALPMWIDFMAEALKEIPEEPLEKPVGMVTVLIDPETGLLARADNPAAIPETFREDLAPTEYMSVNTAGEGAAQPIIDIF
jgi:penicillin-binding protein 1A